MDQRMQQDYMEEISLRELIETLIKRKTAILAITAVFILGAALASFVIMEPVYEAKAVLRLNQAPIGMEDYVAQMTNHEVLSRTVSDLALQEREIDAGDLKGILTIENVKDTALIEVAASHTDPALAADMANELAVNSKGLLIPIYESMLARTEEALALTEKTLEASREELEQASEFVILKKNLVEDPALAAYLSQNGANSLSIELRSEEMNTRYLAIQQKIFNDNLALIQKQEEAANLQSRIDTLKLEISGQAPVDTFAEVLLVSKATAPKQPVSPRKALNLAIGAVLGLMAGIFWAFFRAYWENTDPANNS